MVWDRREAALGLEALRDAVARLLTDALVPEPLLSVSAGAGPEILSTKAATSPSGPSKSETGGPAG